MPAVLGNLIAIALVVLMVFFSLRSILKDRKNGGCTHNCSCCSGCACGGEKH